MTLGELISLYKAEQEGKQIVCEKAIFDDIFTRYVNFDVKLEDMNLEDLLNFKENENVTFYVKGEREI